MRDTFKSFAKAVCKDFDSNRIDSAASNIWSVMFISRIGGTKKAEAIYISLSVLLSDITL